MACFHPLKAYIVGRAEDGKKKIVFADKYVPSESPYVPVPIDLPCGQCIGCRLQYSRMWADRCMMELESHDSAYFITLTYDDEYLPVSYYGDSEGNPIKVYSLRKSDLQKFFKRLRKAFPDDHIRYYACGEYGDQTKRPHYHCIVYGLHLNDLVFYKRSNLKDLYYNSPSLSKVWPYGFSVVGAVTWESCAYTARYVVKKIKGLGADFYDTFNIEPEFVVMSRRPGIGNDYFHSHPDLFDYKRITIGSDRGSVSFSPPRYFKQLLEQTDPVLRDKLFHADFDSSRSNFKSKLSLVDYSPVDILLVEEYNKLQKSKALHREL